MISSIFFCALTFFIEVHVFIYILRERLQHHPTSIFHQQNTEKNTMFQQQPQSIGAIERRVWATHRRWAIRQSHRQLYRRLCQSHAVHGGRKKRKLESQVGATLKRCGFQRSSGFVPVFPNWKSVGYWEILFSGFKVKTHSNSIP